MISRALPGEPSERCPTCNRLVASRLELQIASEIRDLSRRIEPAASPEWVRNELEYIANKLEVWSKMP